MARDIIPVVYLLASHKNRTFYVGVTSNLMQRLYQHREAVFDGFSKDYGIKRWFGLKHMKRWRAQSSVKNALRIGTGIGKSIWLKRTILIGVIWRLILDLKWSLQLG
jgi:predicted GIY-YIG superfamily endonuclease